MLSWICVLVLVSTIRFIFAVCVCVFFFKQKTAYEMRISDWSSDVCSSDLVAVGYDGRLSSPALETALIEGLNGSGIHAVRIGMGPTPLLYYAEAVQDVDGAIQITGRHNPAN